MQQSRLLQRHADLTDAGREDTHGERAAKRHITEEKIINNVPYGEKCIGQFQRPMSPMPTVVAGTANGKTETKSVS